MNTYIYPVKTSINGRILTIDNINDSEYNDFKNNEYLNKYDNLIIERNDNKIVEYIKEDGIFIVSNKFKRGIK